MVTTECLCPDACSLICGLCRCAHHPGRDCDVVTLYCLPREAGDPERVAAGLAQAAIAEGLAREDEEWARARGFKEEAGGP